MTPPNHLAPEPEGHLIISDQGIKHILSLNTVLRLESRRIYTIVFLKGRESITSSRNLGYHESQLPENCFFKISRSCVINLFEVKKYYGGRGLTIVLSDDSQVRVSYRNKTDFLRSIENFTQPPRRVG